MEESVKLLSMILSVLVAAVLAAGRMAGSMWGGMGLSRRLAGAGKRGSSSPPGPPAGRS